MREQPTNQFRPQKLTSPEDRNPREILVLGCNAPGFGALHLFEGQTLDKRGELG